MTHFSDFKIQLSSSTKKLNSYGSVETIHYLRPIRGLNLWGKETGIPWKYPNQKKLILKDANTSAYPLPRVGSLFDLYPKRQASFILFFWHEEYVIDYDYYESIGRININSFNKEIHPEYKNRAGDAINALNIALKLNSPNQFMNHFQIGQAYFYSGQTRKSISAFQKAYSVGNSDQRRTYLHEFLKKNNLIDAVLSSGS